MIRPNKAIVIFLISAVAIILIEFGLYRRYTTTADQKKKVSVVVYDEGKNWQNLKAGADLAAEAEGCEVTYITLDSNQDAAAQYEIIENELNQDIDAVLVAAVNSEELGERFSDTRYKNLVFIQNGIDSDKYVTVSPDNYQMGVDIAKLIIENEDEINSIATIYYDDTKEYIDKRFSGIEDGLSNTSYELKKWTRLAAEDDIYGLTLSYMKNDNADVLVVLNDEVLGQVMKAVSDSGQEVVVYAIANSDEAVYYLDSKKIKYLVFPDEFGIGYAAMKSVLSPDDYKKADYNKIITYKEVNRGDMYSGEYEKVLFPFVK